FVLSFYHSACLHPDLHSFPTRRSSDLLVYASFYYRNDPQVMIESLVDNLSPGSVEIDLVKVNGSIFKDANERLLNLYLVAKNFSSAAIFDTQGHVLQAKDFL